VNRTALLKLLKRNGVEFHRHGSSHDIYRHKVSGKKIAIPRHNEFDNMVIQGYLKIVSEFRKEEY